MKTTYLIPALLCAGLLFPAFTLNAQLFEDEFDSMRNIFVPALTKKAKVKTCTITYYDVEEGEKSDVEKLESFEFDTEGKLIKSTYYWDNTGLDIDELFFEYNDQDQLVRILIYEGGRRDAFDTYYWLFTYDGTKLKSAFEYYVDMDHTRMEGKGEGEIDVAVRYAYDGQGRVIMQTDTVNNEYYIFKYEDEFGYRYPCNMTQQDLLQKPTEVVAKYSKLSSASGYTKYKDGLIVEDNYGGATDAYEYFKDGRMKALNEVDGGKVYSGYKITYKKKVPSLITYYDKEDTQFKEYYKFDYVFYK